MRTFEIMLCSACKGSGVIRGDEMTDYHKCDYITHVKDCKNCNGTGRLHKITTVTYEPFKKPELGIF